MVDDDERVLRSYARLLGTRHRIMVAYDGREAIDMIRSGSSPDVLVVELELPGAEGRELLAWLEAQRPDLARRTILATSGGFERGVHRVPRELPGAGRSQAGAQRRPARGD